MSEISNYQVEPAQTPLKTIEDLWHMGHAANAMPTYAHLLILAVGFIVNQQAFLSIFHMKHTTAWIGILSFIGGVLICILIARGVRLIKCQLHLPVVNRQIQEKNLAKAEAATEAARNHFSAIHREREKMQADFLSALSLLVQAEAEYKKSAYTEFLNVLEKSLWQIQALNSGMSSLKSNLESYRKCLIDSRHNFPKTPVQAMDLPDTSKIVTDLQRVAKLGKTNEGLNAAIEQRWFSKALFAGYQTIPEAMEYARTSLYESVNALKREMNAKGM